MLIIFQRNKTLEFDILYYLLCILVGHTVTFQTHFWNGRFQNIHLKNNSCRVYTLYKRNWRGAKHSTILYIHSCKHASFLKTVVCINATWLRGHVIHAMQILVLNEFPYEPIQLARVCATTFGTHDVETASHEFSKFGLLIHFNTHIIHVCI